MTKRDDAAAKTAAWIARQLASAPQLSEEQKARLVKLLRPARDYLRAEEAVRDQEFADREAP